MTRGHVGRRPYAPGVPGPAQPARSRLPCLDLPASHQSRLRIRLIRKLFKVYLRTSFDVSRAVEVERVEVLSQLVVRHAIVGVRKMQATQ